MQRECVSLIIHFSIIVAVVIILSVKVDSLWCLMIRGLQQKELQSRCRQKVWQFFAQPFCHHHQCFCTWYHSSNHNEPNKLKQASCMLVTTSVVKFVNSHFGLKIPDEKDILMFETVNKGKTLSKKMSSQKHMFWYYGLFQ